MLAVNSGRLAQNITTAVLIVAALTLARTGAAERHTRYQRLVDAGVLKAGLTPFQQWIHLENTTTFPQFQRPTTRTRVPVVLARRSEVQLLGAQHLGEGVRAALTRGDSVAWIQHPDNTLSEYPGPNGTQLVVPYAKAAPSEYWKANYTASRSLVVYTPEGKVLGLKCPTDHPNYQARQEIPKADLVEETTAAVRRGRHVGRVEHRAGSDPDLIILPDVMAVREKKSGNGIVVRDLTRIAQSDRIFMPGFGLAKYGKALGVKPRALARLEARLTGKAKALLLLRYGLWSESPHAQNKLYPLRADGKLTGQIALRDLTDSYFVEPIARALGYGREVEASKRSTDLMEQSIPSDWQLTIAGFDGLVPGYVDYSTLVAARSTHDHAIIATVRDRLRGQNAAFDLRAREVHTLPALNSLLLSGEGLAALRSYGKRVLRSTD